MTNGASHRIELNGAPARLEDLRALVQTNYGHFTSMQVRDGRVRGLGLHLDRLIQGTRELFGCELDRERLRDYLRLAVNADALPLSLRVNVFSHALDRTRMNAPVAPDVLVMVGAAAESTAGPLRLKSFCYQRDLPAIKHVGTFPLFHYRRLALQAGFDDALFVAADGCISEASVWNIGFHDGRGIVWPDGPQLRGTGMQLLQAGLARKGVSSVTRTIRLQDMGNFRAAFLTNATTAACPVTCIDELEFVDDEALMTLLVECHDSNPLDAV